MSAHNSGVVVRGNVFANASSHGLQARAGGIIENNLFLKNPIGMVFGNGTSFTPGGVRAGSPATSSSTAATSTAARAATR